MPGLPGEIVAGHNLAAVSKRGADRRRKGGFVRCGGQHRAICACAVLDPAERVESGRFK